jgi:uncharacterized iron-regulated protein
MKIDDITESRLKPYITFIFIASMILFHIDVSAQDKPAYTMFLSNGKEATYAKMVKDLTRADVVFFGELHNNPIAHWLELELAKSLYENNANLVLAMEMFETDDQIVIDEYLKGTIEEKHLLSEAKVWDNYQTDYKPLMDFAKRNGLKLIATNIPRRYANLVYRKGLSSLDSLSHEAQAWISPLPIQIDLELSGYKNMIDQMEGHGVGNGKKLAMSQAIKDATMAHFILKNKTSNNIIFHVNGAYHSQDGEGILWYIKRSRPETRTATIHVVEQSEIDKLDTQNIGKADYIICVPESMTKTF